LAIFLESSGRSFHKTAAVYLKEFNTVKLEKIQERALRFIYEDYNSTYEELLHIAKVPSLQIRRMALWHYNVLTYCINCDPKNEAGVIS
jgi:hypothetical protein